MFERFGVSGTVLVLARNAISLCLSVSGVRLGGVLGPSWGVFGGSWKVFGKSRKLTSCRPARQIFRPVTPVIVEACECHYVVVARHGVTRA